MSEIDVMAEVMPTTAELRAIEKQRLQGWYSLTSEEARRIAAFLGRLAVAKEATR